MAAEIKCDPELKNAHAFIDIAGDSRVSIDPKVRGQKRNEKPAFVSPGKFVAELKRRNIYKAGIAHAVVGKRTNGA
jgi:hypothetical protein